MKLQIGDTLLYSLTYSDVSAIHQAVLPLKANPHYAGSLVPLIVVAIWPHEYGTGKPGVNGQAIIDGNFSLWITSAGEGEGQGQWRYRE